MDYSSFGLKDKIAVVTGASQGIGRAIAIGLAQAGANLVLAKHPGGSMTEIEQVCAEIKGLGREAVVVITDVSMPVELTALMKAAAKAGVHHLSRALSLEWAHDGVVVNVVAPCITETASRKNILERPGYKEWATGEMIPRGRWNQPEDLVGSVLFLASDLADMVVGHVLMVDGGWTIH